MHKENEGEGAIGKANVIMHEKSPQKWQSYLWDSLDKSPDERRFLFKLDFALLTFASLGWRHQFHNMRG